MKCYYCKQDKDVSEFYSRNNGLLGHCKPCHNKIAVIHRRVKKNLVLDYCRICNTHSKRLDLASINHKYTENPKDYLLLCPPCHTLYDSLRQNRNNHKGKHLNKEKSLSNIIKIKGG